MNIEILPKKLSGSICASQSKSHGHRLLIASALANAWDFEKIDTSSDDVKTTKYAMMELMQNEHIPYINCNQSGTTLRMILPILAVLKKEGYLILDNQLAKRPIQPLIDVLNSNGCQIEQNENVIHVKGSLCGGTLSIIGDVSSQFISGLLYALPMATEDSILQVTTEICSRPYVDMTLGVLKDFGIKIHEEIIDDNVYFKIPGNQKYAKKANLSIENDWSNGAFWLTANYLGSNIQLFGLDDNSIQGDKKIIEILEQFKSPDGVVVDLKDIPDLFPILAVAASFREKGALTEFKGIQRLRLKESDRVISTYDMITSLGGNLEIEKDVIYINSDGFLNGGTIYSCKDHRIAMAAAIAATSTLGNVTIMGANAIDKSYPDFLDIYVELGGQIAKF